MNDMQIFTYGETPVRTVMKDNEPWFVLKDVCEVLGISKYRDTADRLDPDERGSVRVDTLGGAQDVIAVNESGLYNVILRSDKPQAKPFRKWVTAEVLPSIRRTGGYIQGQDVLSPAELMAKALMVAQQTLAERDARISALTVENEIMFPKAQYFDALADRNTLTSIRETAKQFEIKERDFVAILIKKKFLYRDKKGKLMPYAGREGLFEVKECFNEKTQWSGTQTLITPKGREVFLKLFRS